MRFFSIKSNIINEGVNGFFCHCSFGRVFFSNLLNFSCLVLKGFFSVVRADVMYCEDLSSFHLVSRDSRKLTQLNTTT